MLKQTTLLSELQSIVGKKHAHKPKNDHDCAVDGLSPQAIVEPGTYEEVAQVLRLANTERLAVIPRGSGFFMHLGNIPARYDIALSLARLDQVIEYEPADLTVTCQAGIPIGRLQECLSQSGQAVPYGRMKYDPFCIGGLLTTNRLNSPNGTARDFTVGMCVVTGDGRVVKAGGRVVKNVAGYDLSKLFIGSLGSLGIILEATFKLLPIPDAETDLELEFRSFGDIARLSAESRRRGISGISMHAQPLRQVTMGVDPPPAGWLAEIRASGSAMMVERVKKEVHAVAAGQGARTFDPRHHLANVKQSSPVGGRPPTLRCSASVLPSSAVELVQMIEANRPTSRLIADPLRGGVKVEDESAFLDRVRAWVTELGGQLVVSGCSPELKRQIDVFGPPPPSFPLMRAIKQQFDPNNVLSPGRFVGRL